VALIQGNTSGTDAGDKMVKRLGEASITIVANKMRVLVLAVDFAGLASAKM
jgi:hypothetical protein